MNYIEFIPFLTPIPAMLMFGIRTSRLDFLKYPVILCSIAGSILLFILGNPLLNLYTPLLILNYSLMLSFGLIFTSQRYNFPQAFSIAYCILFINVFFWEIPIYMYTFLCTGQYAWYSQLAPLALFPATHIYKLAGTIKRMKAITLLTLGLAISTMFLVPVIVNGWVIWISPSIATSHPQTLMDCLWFINRFICYIILLKVFHRQPKNINISI